MTRHYHETHSPIPHSPARLRNLRGRTAIPAMFVAPVEFDLPPGAVLPFNPFFTRPHPMRSTDAPAALVAIDLQDGRKMNLRFWRNGRAPEVLRDDGTNLQAELQQPERLPPRLGLRNVVTGTTRPTRGSVRTVNYDF